MSEKKELVENREAETDLQSALSDRKAIERMRVSCLEKREMGDLGTAIAPWFFWGKQARLCIALFTS